MPKQSECFDPHVACLHRFTKLFVGGKKVVHP